MEQRKDYVASETMERIRQAGIKAGRVEEHEPADRLAQAKIEFVTRAEQQGELPTAAVAADWIVELADKYFLKGNVDKECLAMAIAECEEAIVRSLWDNETQAERLGPFGKPDRERIDILEAGMVVNWKRLTKGRENVLWEATVHMLNEHHDITGLAFDQQPLPVEDILKRIATVAAHFEVDPWYLYGRLARTTFEEWDLLKDWKPNWYHGLRSHFHVNTHP